MARCDVYHTVLPPKGQLGIKEVMAERRVLHEYTGCTMAAGAKRPLGNHPEMGLNTDWPFLLNPPKGCIWSQWGTITMNNGIPPRSIRHGTHLQTPP